MGKMEKKGSEEVKAAARIYSKLSEQQPLYLDSRHPDAEIEQSFNLRYKSETCHLKLKWILHCKKHNFINYH